MVALINQPLPAIVNNCLYMDSTICGKEFAGYPVAIGVNTGISNAVWTYNDITSFQATLDNVSNATATVNSLRSLYGCTLGEAFTNQAKNLRYQRTFFCAKFVHQTLEKKLCSLPTPQEHDESSAMKLSQDGPGLCEEQCSIIVSQYKAIVLNQELCVGPGGNFSVNEDMMNRWTTLCNIENTAANSSATCSKGSHRDALYCGK